MFTVNVGGTTVQIDGDLDPSLPLVILLHGMSGSSFDMTDPATGRPGLAFDRTASFPLLRDEGFQLSPPTLPVASFFMDPPLGPLTSWRQALNDAGFSTLSYSQVSASDMLAPAVTELDRIATEVLLTDTRLSGLRLAFVAHSRGGLLARLFLTSVAAPALVARVAALVTLHSPHLGSGIASTAVVVDSLAAALQVSFTSAGVTPPGILDMLRSLTMSAALPEIAVGSPVLAAIAAAEPVPGVSYHTFGGTSTAAVRLWANVYTPDSTVPLPIPFLPFPLFHWSSTPVFVGAPLVFSSFAPFAPVVPVVTEILGLLATFAATTPELAPGSGDGLVSDARAHLPFSLTRTTNPLNHAEALWDPTLQAQVVAILLRLRSAPVPEIPNGQVMVPDVRGLGATVAANQIRSAGLVPVFRGSSESDARVYRQAPLGESLVGRGSSVTLELRRGPIL